MTGRRPRRDVRAIMTADAGISNTKRMLHPFAPEQPFEGFLALLPKEQEAGSAWVLEATSLDVRTGIPHVGGGGGATLPLVSTQGLPCANPLVCAAFLAFDHHLPLLLSPDAIWACVLQGVSHHIQHHVPTGAGNPITGVAQKVHLTFRDDSLVLGARGTNDWTRAIGGLCRRIARHLEAGRPSDVQAGIARATDVRFTTSTPATAAAFSACWMAAVQKYFQYTLVTACGIPRVELRGTRDDWERLSRAIDDLLTPLDRLTTPNSPSASGAFGAFGACAANLGTWRAELQRVLAFFLRAYDAPASRRTASASRAATGSTVSTDTEFWRSAFKRHGAAAGSGTVATVSGWVRSFVLYDRDGRPVPHCPDARVDPARFAASLSTAPMEWKYLGSSLELRLMSGLLGVRQDPGSGALEPEVGWLIGRRASTRSGTS